MLQPLLDTINAILAESLWWNKQVKGNCGGDISHGIHIPRGIAAMRHHKEKYGGIGKSTVLLQHYKKIANERLNYTPCCGFFKVPNVREAETTMLFYQLLARLTIDSIQPEDQHKFSTFLEQINADVHTPLVSTTNATVISGYSSTLSLGARG